MRVRARVTDRLRRATTMTPTADERATGATADESARPTGVRHGMVLLAMFVAVLLYLDRVCLSTAANVVQRDLGISGPEMDWVLSAFFWTYALAQLPAGWIGDRFGARWTLAAYVLLWSAMTGLMGIASGVTALVVLRLGCGLFEAGAYPVAAGIVARWVPYRSRGIASAIVAVGGRLGGALAPVLTVWLMLVATRGLGQAWAGGGAPGPGSWRLPMIAYGLVGIVVAAIFAWRFRDWPHEHPAVNAAELSLIQDGQARPGQGGAASAPPVLALCRHGSLWLCSFVQFAANLGWAFIVTKMPTYLAEVHGSSVSQQGWLQSLPLAAGVLGLFTGGRFTDFSARRFGPRWGRALVMAVSRLAVAGAFAAVLFVRDPVAAAVCLAVIGFATDLGMPAVWTFGQDIGGRNVGAVVGWGNMWGNIGAAISPLFFGILSRSFGDDVTAGWQAAFLACLAVQLLAAVAAMFVSSSRPLQHG
jgi:MFS family permease